MTKISMFGMYALLVHRIRHIRLANPFFYVYIYCHSILYIWIISKHFYRRVYSKQSLCFLMSILTIHQRWNSHQKCGIQIVYFNIISLKHLFYYYNLKVYADGRVCISILHPPGADRWGYEVWINLILNTYIHYLLTITGLCWKMETN